MSVLCNVIDFTEGTSINSTQSRGEDMVKKPLTSLTGGREGVRHQQRPENSEFLRRGRWRPDPGPLELSGISQPGRPGSFGPL